MSAFRRTGNAIQIIAFLLHGLLYWSGRILGCKLAFVPWVGIGIAIGSSRNDPQWISPASSRGRSSG